LFHLSTPFSIDNLFENDDLLQDLLDSLLKDSNSPINVKEEPGTRTSKKNFNDSQASKKRKFNPDAEKIAAVTEEALRSLDIDPSSQDAKKKRRQIRNRLSAQFHRDRKNAYIKTLEDANDTNTQLIKTLKLQISTLEKENLELKEQLTYYQTSLMTDASSVSAAASVATTNPSDSELSYCPSPTSESPLHTPNVEHSLPSFREITSSSRSTLPIPLPMAKTLSFLSVLCILCVTYFDHPALRTGGNSVTGPIIEPAPHQQENPFAPFTLPSNSEQSYNRRKLEEITDEAMEEVLNFNAVSVKDHEEVSHDPKVPSLNETFFHLRGASLNTKNLNTSENGKIVFVTKDIIPFHHLASSFSGNNDWFMNQPDEFFNALSYSNIRMKSGVALFDPSMKLGKSPFQNYLSSHQQHVKATVPNSLAVVPATLPLPTHDVPRIDYPEMIQRHESQQQLHRNHLTENKNWPAVTVPSANLPFVHQSETLQNEDHMDCSHCPHDDSLLLSKLLSEANLVTLNLPASSVRLGKSIQDSKDGTFEGIFEMFNLKSENDTNSSVPSSVYHNLLNDASVEINCVILSAKLIMNAQKQ
jgi:hypothetical protein